MSHSWNHKSNVQMWLKPVNNRRKHTKMITIWDSARQNESKWMKEKWSWRNFQPWKHKEKVVENGRTNFKCAKYTKENENIWKIKKTLMQDRFHSNDCGQETVDCWEGRSSVSSIRRDDGVERDEGKLTEEDESEESSCCWADKDEAVSGIVLLIEYAENREDKSERSRRATGNFLMSPHAMMECVFFNAGNAGTVSEPRRYGSMSRVERITVEQNAISKSRQRKVVVERDKQRKGIYLHPILHARQDESWSAAQCRGWCDADAPSDYHSARAR